MSDWRQKHIDRATLLARKEERTITSDVVALVDLLVYTIHKDTDPESRLPRWGEVLNLICVRSRQDWYATTGRIINVQQQGDEKE